MRPGFVENARIFAENRASAHKIRNVLIAPKIGKRSRSGKARQTGFRDFVTKPWKPNLARGSTRDPVVFSHGRGPPRGGQSPAAGRPCEHLRVRGGCSLTVALWVWFFLSHGRRPPRGRAEPGGRSALRTLACSRWVLVDGRALGLVFSLSRPRASEGRAKPGGRSALRTLCVRGSVPSWVMPFDRQLYFSVIPPSTRSSIPVTYFASSLARNRAALATSQASPIWPIGHWASRTRHISSTSPLE